MRWRRQRVRAVVDLTVRPYKALKACRASSKDVEARLADARVIHALYVVALARSAVVQRVRARANVAERTLKVFVADARALVLVCGAYSAADAASVLARRMRGASRVE